LDNKVSDIIDARCNHAVHWLTGCVRTSAKETAGNCCCIQKRKANVLL